MGKLLLPFLLAFGISLNLWGQMIPIHNAQAVFQINKQTSYLLDTQKQYTLTDILKPENQVKFQQQEKDVMSFGYYEGCVWVKIELQKTDTIPQNWVLHQDWVLTDSILFYTEKQGKWTEQYIGRNTPYQARFYQQASFAFPLQITDNQPFTCYLRLSGGLSSLASNLSVETEKHLETNENVRLLFYGLFFGVLLCMFLYNLLVGLFLQDRSYFYYTLSILSTSIIFSTASGYGIQLLWGGTTVMVSSLYSRLALAGFIVSTILFTNSFLETKKYVPILFNIFRIMLGAVLITAIVTYFEPSTRWIYSLASLHTLLLFLVGLLAWKKGNKVARFYVLAWFTYLLGAILFLLSNSGILPAWSINRHLVEIGSVLEVVLLSLALGDRYRLYRKQREEAQERALKVEKEAKEQLEAKVSERTEELQTANEDLESSKNLITKKHSQLTANLKYAHRIQDALTPDLDSLFPQNFVFSRPRDIVSGDFYWASETEEKKIIALADCTGHGTSAAFVTLIGTTLLNRIINELQITDAAQILEQLDKGVEKLFKSNQTDGLTDGMDIAILIFDKNEHSFTFAGANAVLYLVSKNKEIKRLKGVRVPIGFSRQFKDKTFSSQTHTFEKDTTFYLASDGFQDQFGGEKDKKFSTRKFQNVLANMATKSFEKQEEHLATIFDDWKGTGKQTDDVLVLGIKP